MSKRGKAVDSVVEKAALTAREGEEMEEEEVSDDEGDVIDQLRGKVQANLSASRAKVMQASLVVAMLLLSALLYVYIEDLLTSKARRGSINHWEAPEEYLQEKWSSLYKASVFTCKDLRNVEFSLQGGQHDDEIPFPEFLLKGVSYGISGSNPMEREGEMDNEEYNKKANEDLLHDLQFMDPPPVVIKCTIDRGGEKIRGFMLYWSDEQSVQHLPRHSKEGHGGTPHDVKVVATGRVYGQPAVYKWWPHVWGRDRERHITMMQSILPTMAEMDRMRSEGQCAAT